MKKFLKTLLVALVLSLFAAQLRGRAFALPDAQDAIRLSPQWRPTRDAGGLHYVGSDKCALCHDEEAKHYPANGMSNTLAAPGETKILMEKPLLTFKNGNFTYTIKRQGQQSLYQISDGRGTLELPILWAFGHAKTGQTYALLYQGVYYESRVSYYPAVNGLDITLGADRNAPASLADAIGQPMKPGDAYSCFNCHSTPAVGSTRFAIEQPTSGVGCEGCHGPGEQHIALAKQGKFRAGDGPTAKGIFNPARLGADELSQQFCGACHRNFEQVMTMPESQSVAGIRFQPYRIAASKCYQAADDRRIGCVACHNPHEEVRTDAAFYDAKCLACHQAKGIAAPSLHSGEAKAVRLDAASAPRTAPACPTGKPNCVTCHMPKTDLPGAHYQFSDHHIRIVRPGEAYPN